MSKTLISPRFLLTTMSLVFAACLASAEETTQTKNWGHESEASVVQVSGNTESDSYSVKQKTEYKFDLNKLASTARYLETKSNGTETAKAWDASLRYERELATKWSAFAQQSVEHDRYAGFVQREKTELGGKYFFIKSDEETFFAEVGPGYQKTLFIDERTEETGTGVVYTEYSKKLSDSASAKLWAKYTHSFDNKKAWLLDVEPSLSVIMSKVFSLKISYLLKHHNELRTANEKRNDTTLTTSLVAKF